MSAATPVPQPENPTSIPAENSVPAPVPAPPVETPAPAPAAAPASVPAIGTGSWAMLTLLALAIVSSLMGMGAVMAAQHGGGGTQTALYMSVEEYAPGYCERIAVEGPVGLASHEAIVQYAVTQGVEVEPSPCTYNSTVTVTN